MVNEQRIVVFKCESNSDNECSSGERTGSMEYLEGGNEHGMSVQQV
jgi:hypothetical protein